MPRQTASRSLLEWVDAVADRFEVEWRSGQPPSVEDYLEGTMGDKRLLLLHELARIDLERRITGCHGSCCRGGTGTPRKKRPDPIPSLFA